jgi:hypothetical protein
MANRIYAPEDVAKNIRSYRDVKDVIDSYNKKGLEYLGDVYLILENADVSILSEIEKNIGNGRFGHLKPYKRDFIRKTILERIQKDKAGRDKTL